MWFPRLLCNFGSLDFPLIINQRLSKIHLIVIHIIRILTLWYMAYVKRLTAHALDTKNRIRPHLIKKTHLFYHGGFPWWRSHGFRPSYLHNGNPYIFNNGIFDWNSPLIIVVESSLQLSHKEFRHWLVVYAVPSHYLNWWWIIINLDTPPLRNKLQWNLNKNGNISIQENKNGKWSNTHIKSE